MGFFGLNTPRKQGEAPQSRWHGTREDPDAAVVDIEEARAEVADILAVWREVAHWPNAAPFDGGVFTDWPRRIAHGIAFLRNESHAVVAYLRHLESP